MPHSVTIAALVIGVALGSPAVSVAQFAGAGAGSIVGVVKDAEGRGVPDVDVTITWQAAGGEVPVRRIPGDWVPAREGSLVGHGVAALIWLVASYGCADSPTTPSVTGLGAPGMRIESVSPVVGSTVVPTAVRITGDGFEPGAKVSVGDTVLEAMVISAHWLTVSIPPRPPGVHTLAVTNPYGGGVRLENSFRFEADLPTDPVTVRVTGQVVAGASDVPIAGASVRLLQNFEPPQPPVTADDDGRFALTGNVRGNAEEIQIEVSRNGLGSWTIVAPRANADQVVLKVPGLLLIRAGRTVRSELAGGPDQIACTFESVPCLRLAVDGPPSTLIDLELIPENGQTLGLILTESFLAPDRYPTRLTVAPSTLFIMGTFGPFTLKAHNVESLAQR